MTSLSRAALVAIACLAFTPAIAEAQETPDALDAQRERFRAGMEKYRAGEYAEAIVIWDAIYREIGADVGYRLAYNLARAYEAFGDPTRAAEHFESYLQKVDKKKADGEALESVVVKQAAEARQALATLAETRGRIRAGSGAVRIDGGTPRLAPFVAYVTPGKHVVTFEGVKDALDVSVAEGEMVDVAPPVAPPPAPLQSPPLLPHGPVETRVMHPFSGAYLYVAGGIALASVAAPIALYGVAGSRHDDYDALNASATSTREGRAAAASDYESARKTAYVSLAIPIVLGTAAVALAVYWFVGSKEQRGLVGTF